MTPVEVPTNDEHVQRTNELAEAINILIAGQSALSSRVDALEGQGIPPPPAPDPPPPPAEGWAVGFGSDVRGGTTLAPVANLAEFEAACAQGGLIVQVAGNLDSFDPRGRKVGMAPHTTVLGAPGSNATLRRIDLQMRLDDLIVQDVTIDNEEVTHDLFDGVECTSTSFWIDHVTFRSTPDELFSSWDGLENPVTGTVSNCLFMDIKAPASTQARAHGMIIGINPNNTRRFDGTVNSRLTLAWNVWDVFNRHPLVGGGGFVHSLNNLHASNTRAGEVRDNARLFSDNDIMDGTGWVLQTGGELLTATQATSLITYTYDPTPRTAVELRANAGAR